MPPSWTPLPGPTKLSEDSGKYFRDQNAARYPPHPFQPAVEAILEQQPDVNTSEIDIAACGSTLGNLLRFVRHEDRAFRMLVEVVGNTVFLVRRENSPTELIPGVHGFGHTFPEAYTTWDKQVKGSESHQRIIRYSFGGMKCLVRFEADGYLAHLVPKQSPAPTNNIGVEDDINVALSFQFGETAIDSIQPSDDQPASITIQHGGQLIPQESIFDLKTRSFRKKDTDVLGNEIQRLWISQIQNFVLAFHTDGVFEETEINSQNVQDKVKRWEADNADTLRKFISLLRKVVLFARGWEDGRLELNRDEGAQVLEFRKQCSDAGTVLPNDLQDRWVTPFREQPVSEQAGSFSASSHLHKSDREEDDYFVEWDDGSEKDYTACSASLCGYCGHCKS